MLFLVVLVLALATVLPAGGDFTRLAALRLRGKAFVGAALAGQIVLISVIARPSAAVAGTVHLATYAVASGFLFANRRLPGIVVIAMGAAFNVIAIAANGGTMPARPAALRAAGIATDAGHFANSATVAHAHLAWAGDVFALPARFGVLANVFSIGDVVLCTGVVLLVHHAAGSRWTAALDRRVGRDHGANDVEQPVDADHLEFMERLARRGDWPRGYARSQVAQPSGPFAADKRIPVFEHAPRVVLPDPRVQFVEGG